MKTYLSIPISVPSDTDIKSYIRHQVESIACSGTDTVITAADIVDDPGKASAIPTILAAILEQCHQIWMGDGWQDDLRCRCEHAFAQAAGIKLVNDSEDLLSQAISAHYRCHGNTEDITYKTTAEIFFEVSDLVDCKLSDIANWLRQQQCNTVVIDGTVHWILYDTRPAYEL